MVRECVTKLQAEKGWRGLSLHPALYLLPLPPGNGQNGMILAVAIFTNQTMLVLVHDIQKHLY